MSWSLPLFTVAGVPVRVHFTFFLLLVWLGALYWLRGGAGAAADGIAFILLLFASVLLHEFGHVFTARRYGIRTFDVTLLPIGGLASIERIPEKPSQEIAIALAGPAVNVVIAGLIWLVLGFGINAADAGLIEDPGLNLFQRVAAANLVLAVFNMIPAFPMDGGRVLRALLATQFGFLRATRIAARIGQGLAIVFGLLGLFGNPLLVLVAVFIFFAASTEGSAAEARSLARGYRAADAMITTFERLPPNATANDAVALLLRTTQQEFPVIDEAGRLLGLVTREGLVNAIKEKGEGAPVSEFMLQGIPLVPGSAALEGVLATLRQQQPAVGVVEGGRLIGYITPENVSELLMVRNARGPSPRTSVPPSSAATRPKVY